MHKAGHDQGSYSVRCEWGPTGAKAVPADIAVVVDVLSFTTTVSVAVERGMSVYPYRWLDDQAEAYADERGALLAIGRFEARQHPGQVSLSPAAMAQVDGVARIVLPSPNGSAISFALRDSGAVVVAASLRNAAAVAQWLAPQVAGGATCVVVPAGERWSDDTLRPCIEDLWGAGAVLFHLAGLTDVVFSPEARVAARAFEAAALPDELLESAGARELASVGFIDDVEIAAEVGVSQAVPVLRGEAFADAVGAA